MTDERFAEIENRLYNSTSEPILEREDYDYYQGGTYLGTKPYYYVDGKLIEGFEQNGKDGNLYFHNDIFKVEGSEGDKLLFINAHKDITDLIAALRAERSKVAELEKANSELKRQVLYHANIKMKLTSRIYELKQSLNYASDVITDMNKQLDAERAKVAELKKNITMINKIVMNT